MSAIGAFGLTLDTSDLIKQVTETNALFGKLGDSVTEAFATPAAAGDIGSAIVGMQAALHGASQAATPLSAAVLRLEAGLQGLAGVARITSTAMALLPGVFAGLPPAVGRTLASMSLAGRAASTLRGQLSPLGGAMAFVELRSLGLSRSTSALAATMAVASSSVIRAGRAMGSTLTTAATLGGRAVGGATSLIGALGVSALALTGPLVGAAGALGGVATGLALVKKSVSSAADFETATTGFVTLLGSAAAAEERMRALADFAASTPFELPEIAEASRTLETLTRGALATGKGLSLVGDVAAAVNRPFGEVAVTVGRLYDGLMSGRPVGEAMQRLQELGVVSGTVRNRIEAAQKAGAPSAEVWAMAEQALGRFTGNMQRQSGTWNGLMSTLGDNIGALFREFGIPVLDTLKPKLQELIEFTGQLAPKAVEAGRAFSGALAALFDPAVWDALGAGLVATFQHSVNTAWSFMQGMISAAGAYAGEVIETALTLLSVATTADFWAGVGSALMSMAASFNALLLEGAAALLDALSKAPVIGDKIGQAAGFVREQADLQRRFAAQDGANAADRLAPAMATFSERVANAGENIAQAFAAGRDQAEPLIDTAANDALLANTVGRLGEVFAAASAPKTPDGKDARVAPLDIQSFESDPFANRRPSAERLTAVSGFGLFVKDPLADQARQQVAEQRRANELLTRIAKATEEKKTAALPMSMNLGVFA